MDLNTSINCLVTTSVLDDFKQATMALFHDLRHGDEDFDKNDIHDYMKSAMESAMTEAEVEGPLTVEQNPLISAAIEYVKGYKTQRGVAEQVAIHLYDLDAEAVRVMKRELDKTGVSW